MSFSMTAGAIRDRTKTVTRRRAGTWKTLKPGDRLMAIEKGMGLKKGERQVELGVIEVVTVRLEPVFKVTWNEVRREGYPRMPVETFCAKLCRALGLHLGSEVRRIEFRYV